MEEHLSAAEQAERTLNPHKPLFIRLLQWKFVIPFMIVLTLVTGPLVYRSYVLNGIPDIGDPFDVEAFGTVNLPDTENARVEYEAAMALIVQLPTGSGVDTELNRALDNGWDYASPAIRKWLDDNRPAMKQWKRGTAKPDFLYVQPKDLNIATLLPLIQEMRTFARLAQLETSRLLAEGKPDEAWDWARAVYLSSRHLGQHGVAIERLVGIAIHAMCINNMMMIAQHPATTEALLQDMLQELQNQYASTAANSTMMKCEYMMMINTIRDPKMMQEMLTPFDFRSPADRVYYELVRVLRIEPILCRLVAQQYWANVLDQIDLPLQQQQGRTGRLDLFERDPAKSYPADRLTPAEIDHYFMKSFLARNFLPAIAQLDTACLRETSRQRAFELCLAARIYSLRNGVYPADANDLVSAGILTDVPIDPYSRTGEKMRYRHDGDEVFAWSIGEDGIDELGVYVDSDNGAQSQNDIGLVLGREKDVSVEAQKP